MQSNLRSTTKSFLASVIKAGTGKIRTDEEVEESFKRSEEGAKYFPELAFPVAEARKQYADNVSKYELEKLADQRLKQRRAMERLDNPPLDFSDYETWRGDSDKADPDSPGLKQMNFEGIPFSLPE